MAVSVTLFRHATHFLQRGIRGVVRRDQTTAAKETTVSVAPMHFTFA